jgi:hypothetical protein
MNDSGLWPIILKAILGLAGLYAGIGACVLALEFRQQVQKRHKVL